MKQLILGGARSGKSRLAQTRAEAWRQQTDGELIYLATAGIDDNEMQARVDSHRAERSVIWQTLEEPQLLAQVLRAHRNRHACILVDCLTLWISNCLHQGVWLRERDALLAEIDAQQAQACTLQLILVSNEVGSGIVPLGELTREFVDASGFLHQALAQRLDAVTLVVAGLPVTLK